MLLPVAGMLMPATGVSMPALGRRRPVNWKPHGRALHANAAGGPSIAASGLAHAHARHATALCRHSDAARWHSRAGFERTTAIGPCAAPPSGRHAPGRLFTCRRRCLVCHNVPQAHGLIAIDQHPAHLGQVLVDDLVDGPQGPGLVAVAGDIPRVPAQPERPDPGPVVVGNPVQCQDLSAYPAEEGPGALVEEDAAQPLRRGPGDALIAVVQTRRSALDVGPHLVEDPVGERPGPGRYVREHFRLLAAALVRDGAKVLLVRVV